MVTPTHNTLYFLTENESLIKLEQQLTMKTFKFLYENIHNKNAYNIVAHNLQSCLLVNSLMKSTE